MISFIDFFQVGLVLTDRKRMMKEGKDLEKVMGPLFPRLHVKDTEKGWPKAPPRNKMALYEQLSVPSQRFNLVPPSSSTQGGGHERSVFSPFYIPPSSPPCPTDKIHSSYSDGLNFNGSREFDRKSMKNGSCKASNVTSHLLSNAKCNSSSPHDLSSSKNSTEEDDFRLPACQHSGDRGGLNPFPMHPGWSTTVAMVSSPQTSIMANCNSSVQLWNGAEKSLKGTNTTDLKSRAQGRTPSVQYPIEKVEIKQSSEKATSHTSVVDKIGGTSKHASVASIGKHPSGSTNECDNSHTGNSRLCQETQVRLLSEDTIDVDGILVEPRCMNGNGIEKKENSSRMRSDSGPRVSLDNSHRSPNDAENRIGESGGEAPLGNVDRSDDESETSMVDYLSGLDISPDDVVGIIGQKHFLKARKAITNQQRVFAVQVFELHRLIKVQKLIAGSPELLIENNRYLSRPSPNIPTKKLTSEYSLKSQSQIIKQKVDSQKACQTTDCPSGKDNSQKPPHCPLGVGVDNGLVSQNSNHVTHSGNTPLTPLAADNNSIPWCFHPPGNQWLVPIMSPSEGLVYKPYMGLRPPNVSFMTPLHGGCGPLSLPPTAGYGVPASHPQAGVGPFSGAPVVAQSYFPPAYVLPSMNPMTSTPAVEQVNPLARGQPNQEVKQVSAGEFNFDLHSRRSCNMSNQKISQALSSCARKFPTSKDSEIQGSSASSPCGRVQGAGHLAEGREERDALPLFPVGPAMGSSDTNPQVDGVDQQARVIKVVPHNPRSATESAARIFRSIQKERQRLDSL